MVLLLRGVGEACAGCFSTGGGGCSRSGVHAEEVNVATGSDSMISTLAMAMGETRELHSLLLHTCVLMTFLSADMQSGGGLRLHPA